MEDNFKPTKENELDLERAIHDLKIVKNGIVKKKVDRQGQLTDVKALIAEETLGDKDTQNLENQRRSLINELNLIELEIREVNDSISSKRKTLNAVSLYLRHEKRTKAYGGDITRQITELKDKYNEFASDNTRVASMRTMAARFAVELETILK